MLQNSREAVSVVPQTSFTYAQLLITIGRHQLEIEELKQDLQQAQVELKKMQEMQDVQMNDIPDLHKQKKSKAIPNWRRG